MYKDFEKLHPINSDSIDTSKDVSFFPGPWLGHVPTGRIYWNAKGSPLLIPTWYTNWRDETLSWHLTCSFHANLNPTPVTIIRGPEAKKFMKENFVNNIDNFPIGIIKHGVLCLENGLIASHGVIMRVDEDVYETHWHSPYVDYLFGLKKYDADIEDISNTRFLFQLQGPKCLEILEKVTEEDLHDIQYRRFRSSSIDGHEVRILRFGMSGGLAYEIHGDLMNAKEVFKKIIKVGSDYGIRPIGLMAYLMNHIEGGFPQIGCNFTSAVGLDEGFMRHSSNDFSSVNSINNGFNYAMQLNHIVYLGSVGADARNHVFNPFEVGLGPCINWNHEFRGKEALSKLKKTNDRDTVTLIWDPEDLCKIYASQFIPGEEPYLQMDYPAAGAHALIGHFTSTIDWVEDADGNTIGRSYGRTHSHYNRSMLSFASLDSKFRAIGTEVYVLWGEPGMPQLKVRAKVAPFPYNQHIVNDGFDVNTIPRQKE